MWLKNKGNSELEGKYDLSKLVKISQGEDDGGNQLINDTGLPGGGIQEI